MVNSGTKRLILFIGLIATASALGFLLWYLFFKAPLIPKRVVMPKPVPISGLPSASEVLPGAPAEVKPSGLPGLPSLPTFPRAAEAFERRLTDTPVTSPAITPDGKGAAYYDPNQGSFLRLDERGQATLLSDKQFFGVETVTWAPKTDKVIAEFPDGSNILLNFTTGEQVTLPKHWEDFSFRSDGEKIAGKSMSSDVDNRWLFVSNADGTASRAIRPMEHNADKVMVDFSPNNQIIAFAKTGDPREGLSQEIILVGQEDENFRSLIAPGFGFEPKWAPDGNRLLFSVYNKTNGYRPELWISGDEGGDISASRRELRLNTWADKCSFQNATTLFCGVPTDLSEGAALERSLFKETSDSIYRIDLATGTQQIVLPPSDNAVENLRVSPDGKTLFYTDAATSRLHEVKLP